MWTIQTVEPGVLGPTAASPGKVAKSLYTPSLIRLSPAQSTPSFSPTPRKLDPEQRGGYTQVYFPYTKKKWKHFFTKDLGKSISSPVGLKYASHIWYLCVSMNVCINMCVRENDCDESFLVHSRRLLNER